MGIKRSSARQKGSQGEADVMIIIQNVLAEAYRLLNLPTPELFRGANGTDIRGISWLAPEVKRHEPRNGNVAIDEGQIRGWWEQAKSQAKPGQIPCLFYRQNRMPWRVVMFGYLELADGGRVRAPVDIPISTFQLWLGAEAHRRLARALKPEVS